MRKGGQKSTNTFQRLLLVPLFPLLVSLAACGQNTASTSASSESATVAAEVPVVSLA